MPNSFRPLTSVAETSDEITALVTRPPGRVALSDALSVLVWHDIGIRVTGRPDGILAAPAFLTALRGALGHGLLDGASAAFREGLACTFSPACAADVLYGPRKIPGGPEVTPPFVPLLDTLPDGAALTFRLFGLATGWSPSVADALVRCIRHGLYLPDGTTDVLQVEDVRIVEGGFASTGLPEVAGRVEIRTLTPLALSDRSKDLWPSILLGLLTRLRAVARWHGLLLQADWEHLSRLISRHGVTVHREPTVGWTRRSSRRGVSHQIEGESISLTVTGPLSSFEPLLLAGSVIGVGRRTTFGLGRIKILVSADTAAA